MCFIHHCFTYKVNQHSRRFYKTELMLSCNATSKAFNESILLLYSHVTLDKNGNSTCFCSKLSVVVKEATIHTSKCNFLAILKTWSAEAPNTALMVLHQIAATLVTHWCRWTKNSVRVFTHHCSHQWRALVPNKLSNKSSIVSGDSCMSGYCMFALIGFQLIHLAK